jgi:hypothetical protein
MWHLIELFRRQSKKLLFSVFVRVVKEDPDFVISPGLIDYLSNADALASTSATRRSTKAAQASKNM